jgi:pimeloyl-ACP methyl ester carboxylesterase
VSAARIVRRFVELDRVTVHCAIAGLASGPDVLLLHQTPRSWDEYREVLPLLGARVRAIAMDTVGFGDSTPLPADEDSIERWAAVAVALLDALGIREVAVVGHHTGAVIAVEMAAAYPDRVRAAVLSGAPFVDAERRRARAGHRAIDAAERHPDGRHLLELWRARRPRYPAGDVDLLERYLVDALKAGPRAAGGHAVVNRYRMEDRVGRIRCPVLIVAPTADPGAFAQRHALAARIAGSRIVEIEGGMVPLPDQMPEAFARVVLEFLAP